ncbi:putative ubiquitin carboxyl-terminal hydrolase MINDY-4 [Holothuria leucospilota]|uniref:Ubiquitin carboxyl-terminal hydrolase MINDY n=1 Tax=Holothuria leucospilota TaxID=206669 RepID=A0A9Q1BP62_HOLLE|nr:putative ubiquitin carboxyl-terminal hydrolase MINDY-4 [Holothuria leucospilota]
MAESPPTNIAHLERLATALELNDSTSFNQNTRNASQATQIRAKDSLSITKKKTSDVKKQEETLPGEVLSLDDIKVLKKTLFGDRSFLFNDDWTNTSFVFQSVQSKCPYGLMSPQNGARGLIACVQAHILKHLMFSEADLVDMQSSSKGLPRLQAERHQRAALAGAMAAILWKAGEKRRAVVAVIHKLHPGLLHTEQRRMEYLADCLRYFECNSYKQLTATINRELDMFSDQAGGGALGFLFSLLLTRTIDRLEHDLQGTSLLTETNRCDTPLLNLMLTGQATPHVFNGKITYDDDGNLLDTPVIGINDRADVGLLIVDREKPKSKDPTKHLGSMLKTPKFPIWVVSLNYHISVLFSTNINLNRDWRSEQKFDLYYLNGQSNHTNATRITVDSRTIKTYSKQPTRNMSDKNAYPIVEECITTRWPGVRIDWNGSIPYF